MPFAPSPPPGAAEDETGKRDELFDFFRAKGRRFGENLDLNVGDVRNGVYRQAREVPSAHAREQVEEHLGKARLRAALEQIPGEVSPTVAGLLQQLSPLQVQQLRGRGLPF